MMLRTLVLLIVLAVPGTAAAQSLEVQSFDPAGSLRSGYLTVFQGSTDLPKDYEAALYLQYAFEPLNIVVDGQQASLIDGQFVAHALGSYSPIHWARLTLEVPVILVQPTTNERVLGQQEGAYSGAGLGDIRLVPAFSFFDQRRGENDWEQYDGFAVGLAVPVMLPTGDSERFQGESFRAEPRLTADYATVSGWGVGANFGFLIRDEQTLANLNVGHQFTFGLAARAPLVDALSVILDWRGSITPSSDALISKESPMELLGAFVYECEDWVFGAGAGFGITDGYGSPGYRTLLSVGYSPLVPEPPPEADTDGDGYVDSQDRCPLEPEDFDGFEDADGCPDLDHDRDGILEPQDKCPDIPEDFDGFQDADGCPDDDNDGDGIPDTADACPDEPETVNDYEDADGCPDEVPVIVTSTHIEITQKIYFDFDSDRIQRRSFELLNAIAATINAHPEITNIQVEGHTDAQGEADYNLDLSQRRAEAVVTALVERGVEATRLIGRGFGESRLVSEGETEADHEANRRVEFLILDETQQ